MRHRNKKHSNKKHSNKKHSNKKHSNKKHSNKKHSNKKHSNTKHRKISQEHGGSAVDAGSYGCVFSPALKCAKNSTNPYNKDNISKLMFNNHADAEMVEMKKVERIIKNIPNNSDYFLVADTNECKPAPLDSNDLENFDSVCNLFTDPHYGEPITSSNINTNLDKLSIINMANGGIGIDEFYKKMYSTSNAKERHSLFEFINLALIKLLKYGIVPLNNLHFNHFDIKYDNILLGKDNKARLIDWSLASENDGKTIPNSVRESTINFNTPVSIIFFNSFVKDSLRKSYEQIKASALFADKKNGQNELLKIVALNMINEAMNPPKNDSHYRIIVDSILRSIYKLYVTGKSENNLINYSVLTTNVVVEYIHAVLLKYVDENGNFDDVRYFYEVFTKNADIWGFILSYSSIVEYGPGKIHKDIINGLCRIMLKYCFSTEFAAIPIDINLLIADLLSLNKISKSVNTPTQQTRKSFNTMRIDNGKNIIKSKSKKNKYTKQTHTDSMTPVYSNTVGP